MAEEEVLDAINHEEPQEDADAPQNEPQQAGWFSFGGFLRAMLMYQLIGAGLKYLTGGGSSSGGDSTAASNLFTPGLQFDLYAHLSPYDDKHLAAQEPPFWMRKNFNYDWSVEEETYSQSIPTPLALRSNQSIYLHVFIVRTGQSIHREDKNYAKSSLIHASKQLNRYMKRRYKKTTNLLTGTTEQSEEEQRKAETMTHEMLNCWHPNMTISLVIDQTPWQRGVVPEPMASALKFSKNGKKYAPIVYLNNYWNLQEDYRPVNESTQEVNLTLTYAPLSMWKYQLYASQEMQKNWTMGLELSDDGDQDSMKRAMLETNPILMGVIALVSLLHTVFEFLAFKNDIQFWKSKKNFEGLSVRTVFWGIGQNVIVFLYVCDNDTNFMVKISLLIGIAIECWKVPKCFKIEVDHANPVFGLIPRVKFIPSSSYVDSETSEYDNLAFSYLRWVMYPLLVCYAIYSLVYEEQKGWYSWILSTLYGYLLMFGFVMMTPQLFINYKLKSVAHLPWRMMTYKFINTFIDDLFAWVIRMPTMYRIGCFRDDVIFLVYLYQYWAYRVDHSRVNEFGVSGEQLKGVEEKKEEEVEKGEEAKEEEGEQVEEVEEAELKRDEEGQEVEEKEEEHENVEEEEAVVEEKKDEEEGVAVEERVEEKEEEEVALEEEKKEEPEKEEEEGQKVEEKKKEDEGEKVEEEEGAVEEKKEEEPEKEEEKVEVEEVVVEEKKEEEVQEKEGEGDFKVEVKEAEEKEDGEKGDEDKEKEGEEEEVEGEEEEEVEVEGKGDEEKSREKMVIKQTSTERFLQKENELRKRRPRKD